MEKIISGISEVGEEDALGGTQTPYGKTTPDGVAVSFDVSSFQVESGQDDYPLEDIVNSVQTEWTFDIIFSDLTSLRRFLGLSEDQFEGDLESAQDEVLTIDVNTIGQDGPKTYYVKTPGPGAGPRTWEIARGKLYPNGDVQLSRDQEIRLSCRIVTLAPESGPVVQVTDAAA